jgi:hypothetical protein
MGFLYVECVCCTSDAFGTNVTHSPGKTLHSRDAALAALLQESRPVWNDATRGAYRAIRRENEA